MVLEYHVNVMLPFQGTSPDYYGNVIFCLIMPRIGLCNRVCEGVCVITAGSLVSGIL